MTYASDGLMAEFWALREKFAVADLQQLRKIGRLSASRRGARQQT